MSAAARTAIADIGVIAVIRLRAYLPLNAAESLVKGGVPLIEITLTTPGALESIAELTAHLPDAIVGAGTVLDADTARRAIDAGAQFIVSPVFDSSVVDACRAHAVVCMAGAFTPAEMLAVSKSGADFIKVFPSSQVGPSFFRDVLAPLPFLKLVPSGGVSTTNAGDWIRAGAAAVSVGTSLTNAESVKPEHGDSLIAEARRLVSAVRTARAERTASR